MELKDIKEIRKKFGLTQIDLAKKSGVSQSLIAKIEAGRLDPTYNKAMKIFNALDELTKKQAFKAEEIMTKKIVSVGKESGAHEIIKKMRKYAISQLPVIEGDKILGVLSEATVLDALLSGKKEIKAKDIMKEAPPTIDKSASITIISSLLKFYPMVLVVEKGKILGVITKSDIIRKVYKG
jgi:predicted transcriptional regulator